MGRAFLDLKVSKTTPSYYDFLVKIAAIEPSLSKAERLTLQKLGELIGSGHRLLEASFLRTLLSGGNYMDFVKNTLQNGLPFDKRQRESLLSVLSFRFIEIAGNPFEGVRLIEEKEDGTFGWTKEASRSLENEEFRKRVTEIVDYVFYSHERYFKECLSKDLPFTHYEQYTRKEVSRLLLQTKNLESTLFGYRVFDEEKVVPIFVTYRKNLHEENTTNYEDRFLSPRLFHWMSRNNLTLESSEIKRLCEVLKNGGKALFFVKKNDSDSLFYFVGSSSGPYSFQAEDASMKNGAPVVSFYFLLERPVREDVYHYLTNGESISEL